MKTIVLSNQKGGVAKTTTAFALADGFGRRGLRVLAVDLDPQCNLTLACGLTPGETETDLYDVFRKKAKAGDALRKTPCAFDLLPGGIRLAGADMEFTQMGREYMLKKALAALAGEYELCVVDTPPTLGILTANAMTAADRLIVPMLADVFSLQGLVQLQSLVDNVREYANPELRTAGLLLTKCDDRQLVSKALTDSVNEVAGSRGTRVFRTHVRESAAVRQAQLMRRSIYDACPQANAVKDYEALLDEVWEEIR